MKYMQLAAAISSCFLSCHTALGSVAAARPASLQKLHRRLEISRAVTTTVSAGSNVSSSRSAQPTILSLATVQEQANMDPELKEFRKLMKDCGATFYLEQTREMTAFMPTNEAVQALSPVDLHKLPWEVKWRILQYHIVPQIVNVEEIPRGASKFIKSWEGSAVKIQHRKQPGQPRLREGRVVEVYLLNDFASIVSDPPRIENSNGASYKINRVLVPPDLDLRTYSTGGRKQEQGVAKQKEYQIMGNSRPRSPKKADGSSAGGDQTSRIADSGDLSAAKYPQHYAVQEAKQSVTDSSMDTYENGTEVPEFLREINHQHARWSQDSYLSSTSRTALNNQEILRKTGGSSSKPPSLFSVLPIEAAALEDPFYAQAGPAHNENDVGSPATGLLYAPGRSSFPNYLRPSFEPLLVGSELQENPVTFTPDTKADHVLLDSSSVVSRMPASASALLSFSPSPAAVPFASSPFNHTRKRNDSLFDTSHEFQSYFAAPSIAALGLAEGLLPEEELVTHYWSRPQSHHGRAGVAASSTRTYSDRSATSGPFSKLSSLVKSINGYQYKLG